MYQVNIIAPYVIQKGLRRVYVRAHALAARDVIRDLFFPCIVPSHTWPGWSRLSSRIAIPAFQDSPVERGWKKEGKVAREGKKCAPSRARATRASQGVQKSGGLLITKARHESGADHARIGSYRPGSGQFNARKGRPGILSAARENSLSRPIAHSCETHTGEIRWGE